MDDPFDLQRFVNAQDAGAVHDQALDELRAGRKRSHWMWFVFPQLQGLGRSPTARRYALTGLAEARAYVAHAVLGPRLLECTRVLAEAPEADAVGVLGPVDAQKLRSSMTLFALAAPERREFATVLDRYFEGRQDDATLHGLGVEA